MRIAIQLQTTMNGLIHSLRKVSYNFLQCETTKLLHNIQTEYVNINGRRIKWNKNNSNWLLSYACRGIIYPEFVGALSIDLPTLHIWNVYLISLELRHLLGVLEIKTDFNLIKKQKILICYALLSGSRCDTIAWARALFSSLIRNFLFNCMSECFRCVYLKIFA